MIKFVDFVLEGVMEVIDFFGEYPVLVLVIFVRREVLLGMALCIWEIIPSRQSMVSPCSDIRIYSMRILKE